ncbi:sensor histidine kinase [Kibdelosporangium aridum]|uniref:histidine kinase n=1 Tax=Kibdelosporangium aridum TaxID=2030 RepID=A0A428YZE2_KIBAR|nr:ATP-binding protein [Kibdelosporangium aridum]RSM76761.1 sensor histidine kinase [Kibdelosporangium aridum]
MSSNQRVRRRWTLQARLLAQLIGLLAVMSAMIGVITEVALSEFLITRLDQQLSEAHDRAAYELDSRDAHDERQTSDSKPPSPETLLVKGQGIGTFGALIYRGDVLARVATADGTHVVNVPAETINDVPLDRTPETCSLGPELGQYRMTASRTRLGDVMVIGLPTSGMNSTLMRLGWIMGGVTLAGLVAAGAVGAFIVRRTLRPLNRVAATAGRVSEMKLDQGEVALSERVPDDDTDPRTEVGKVGHALNRMLEHISAALAARQASETRVRKFVADASHELRTPLAAIRGYAELARRSGDEVPPAVAHAMSRVESESARMTTLVEDLLLLARLDSGRPTVHEPVDLSRVVTDAVADAHVAGRDHHWVLDAPGVPVMVMGDSGQLHQVIMNLLSNARTHTPPGTTVTTKLSTEDKDVVVTIADNGPGIPAELQPEVFERFARGDSSRSRAAGSTGLGLAIVAAVVGAHGGSISLSSQPGQTVFTIRMTKPLQDR